MSEPSRPGWYDDPDDSSQLRYHDGVVWTGRTTAKSTRATATQERPTPSASGGRTTARTPDGVALADFVTRVRAYVIDTIVLLVTLVLGSWFGWKAIAPWVQRLQDADRVTGDLAEHGLTALDGRWMAALLGLQVLLFVAYQLFFLTRSGATPGKRVCGISVRLLIRPCPPTMDTAIKRIAIPTALLGLANVALLAPAALLALLADLLWPIKDRRRQAIHDKVAETVVVEGPQPSRR